MQHVQNLLSAMTRQEKAHFSTLYRDDKQRNFYKLYKVLQSNPAISFQALEKKFSDIPQLHYELNNLYKRLLKSLTTLQLNSRDSKTSLKNRIRMTRILMEKKNTKESLKMLRKAKREAVKTESFSELLEVLKLEEDLTFQNMAADIYDRMESIYKERDELLRKMRQYYDLNSMARFLIKIQYDRGMFVPFDKLPDLLKDHPILDGNETLGSERIRYLANFCRGLRAITTGEYKDCVTYQVEVINSLRKFKYLGRGNVVNILVNINNLLAAAAMGKLDDDFEYWLKELRSVKLTKVKDRRLASFYELAQVGGYICRWLKLERYPDLEERTLKYFDEHSKSLTQTQINNLSFSLIYGAMFRQEYDRAHGHLARLLSLPVNNYAKHRLRMAAVCIYLGQGNFDLVKSELNAYKRTLEKADRHNEVTATFIRYINGHLADRSTERLQRLTSEAYQEFKRQMENPNLRNNFIQFNLLNWIACCQSKYFTDKRQSIYTHK